MIYYSLVYPTLIYCVTVWGGVPSTLLKPVVTTQKRILRFVTHNLFDSHTKPIFLQHKILPFSQVYKLQVGILMHKIQNKSITGSYNLTPLHNKHEHFTRLSNKNNFYPKYCRTSYGKSSFCSQGVVLWRSVPTELKTLPVHIFKSKYKQILFNEILL